MGDELHFWWLLLTTLALLTFSTSLADTALAMGRRPRRVIALPLALVIISLLCALALMAFIDMRVGGNGPIQLAALFLAPLAALPVLFAGSSALQGFVAATAKKGRPTPQALLWLTEPLPDEQPDAALGRARERIDVTYGAGRMIISIPKRPSGSALATGVAFILPGLLVVARLVYSIAFAASVGVTDAGLVLLGSIGVVGNLMVNLPFLLLAAWGAHLLFGREVITLGQREVSVRKAVWEIQFFSSSVELTGPLSVVAERDQRRLWGVALSSSKPGMPPRSIRFGAGGLTHAQAEQIAAAVEEFYETRPQCLTSASS